MTLRIALVALALTSLAGCPDTAPADAGRDAATRDAPADIDTNAIVLPDSGLPDAVVVINDDAMEVDAFSADAFAPDAPAVADAPTRDARGAAAGMCNPEACTPTCLIAIRCVTECGGPVTECGCCACAPGSMSVASCTSSM